MKNIIQTNPINFILAGNSYFKLKSERTENEFMYKVTSSKNKPNLFNVYLINHNKKAIYIGVLVKGFKAFQFREYTKNRFLYGIQMTAFSFAFEIYANNYIIHPQLKFSHIGKCGKCGRTLTDEKSFQLGFGKTCYDRMNITNGKLN